MEIQKVECSVEGRILGALIMSSQLLGNTRQIVNPSLFETKTAKIVSQWVVDFYDSVGKAPEYAISDIYTARKKDLDEADADLVYKFLQNASSKWAPTNEKYSEQMVVEYFQDRQLDSLIKQLERMKANGNLSGANAAIAGYMTPEITKSNVIDILKDTAIIQKAFNKEEQELFILPDKFDRLFGGPICYGDFISLLAPSKGGKTWWLIWLAMQAMAQGCKVLFASCEMDDAQMVRRFWQYMSGQAQKAGIIKGSTFQKNGDKFDLVPAELEVQEVDTSAEAIQKIQKDFEALIQGGSLRLKRYDTGTLTWNKLDADLKTMEVESGWVPNVIVVDYLDIFKLSGRGEKRDQLDELWKEGRGFNLAHPGCLITASQITGGDILSGKRDANRGDMSDCKSKQNHITRMVTINRNPDDKRMCLARLVSEVQRDGKECFEPLYVTQCFEIGRPWMECEWGKDVNINDYDWEGIEP